MGITQEQRAQLLGVTWCVYIKLRPDCSPFYVGMSKGTQPRPFDLEHRSKHFKMVVKKYGAENIKTLIMPVPDKNSAYDLEEKLIARYALLGCRLVNVAPGGRKWLDSFYTSRNITSLLIPQKQTKRYFSPEAKKVISEANKGKPHVMKGRKYPENGPRPGFKKGVIFSESHRENISKANTGKPCKAKGTKITEETKKKISKGLMGKIPYNKGKKCPGGKKRGPKPGTLSKVKGRKHSKTTKQLMSMQRKGVPKSRAHVEAVVAAIRKNNALRKSAKLEAQARGQI